MAFGKLSRRGFVLGFSGAAVMATLPARAHALDRAIGASGRELKFLNLHTDETLTAEYWQNGRYVPDALAAINHVLRDHRAEEEIEMDVRLLDLLEVLQRKLENRNTLHVISGYRAPKTNAAMNKRSSGVAKHSLHMDGRAIDIRLPGTALTDLHKAARALKKGGVGLYTGSDFVHVDTGRVRYWGA